MIRAFSPSLKAAALLAVLVPLGTASAQLGFSAAGPVNPANGFPSSYTDTRGLSLDLCLTDPVLCGLLSPVAAPTAGAFPANYGGTFPEENFYNRCVAKMNTNGTSLATLVVALEGAFLNGPVVAGDQIVFSRVRIRVAGLVAGQPYTVTTPVGIFNFIATNGNVGINNTEQVGGVIAGDFTSALSGHSGPFLQWDTDLPLLDANGREYLGNPALDHTITGSPGGTNFFRIDGANVGGPGVNRVQTNVFQIIGLKTAAVLPPAPVAAFNAAPLSGVSPLTVSFSDASTGTVTSWLWNFGDGSLSNLRNPSHLYGTGTYSVSLTATGPGGSNTISKPGLIVVTNAPPAAPVANFNATPLSGTAPLNVAFSDASTGTVASWSWSFGDGATSTLQNPSHVYAAGTYSVALTVTGPGGSNALTKVGLITANNPAPGAPVAAFNAAPQSGTAPLSVAFTDASTGLVSTWAWSFGDGATSTLQNPSHSYAAGTYSVSLTVTGPGGSSTLNRPGLIVASNPAPTGLTLSNPVPGIAGVPNTLVVTGAQPNSPVGFVSGLTLGASVFNSSRCVGGIPIGIARPNRTLGTARANAQGVATLVTTPPANSAGKIFHFQAVEPATCSASNVVSEQL